MADEPTSEPGEPAGDTRVGEVYLVRRRREFCYLRTDWSGSRPLPVERNVGIFRTREEAEAFAEELNTGRIPSPPDANLFLFTCEGFDGDETCYTFFDVTEDEFASFLQTLGIELPDQREIHPRWGNPYVGRDWGTWWERIAPSLTDERRAELWQKCGGLWFYDIVKLELRAPPGDPLHSASPT